VSAISIVLTYACTADWEATAVVAAKGLAGAKAATEAARREVTARVNFIFYSVPTD
jgi:hypothetical protein